jgi:uncharacterized protein YbbC (DUF1343 family)
MRIIILTCTLSLFVLSAFAKIHPGLDVLISKNFSELKGKKIGLICNQTSRSTSGLFTPDIFIGQKEFKTLALFSPEHGFNGVRKAGRESDSVETYKDIPVYSLYGSARKPTKKMLAGITALVFDIQDIGVRPYTYLSTMILSMEASAESNIEFIVLDRLNPLGGERIEGNILDTSLKSFVGIVPIPYIHGMTLGELATMAKGERWFKNADKLKLQVIRAEGLTRSVTWDKTELAWTAPSPNIPAFESAIGCAMTGALGELGIISVGIGSDMPFLRLGSRLISGEKMKMILDSCLPDNVKCVSEDFTTPFGDSIKSYYGVRIILPNELKSVVDIYTMQFKFLHALLQSDSNILRSYNATSFSSKRMLDKVTGTTELRRVLGTSGDLDGLFKRWKKDEEAFKLKRKKYLLYN